MLLGIVKRCRFVRGEDFLVVICLHHLKVVWVIRSIVSSCLLLVNSSEIVTNPVTGIQGRKPRLVVWLRTGVSSGNWPTNIY